MGEYGAGMLAHVHLYMRMLNMYVQSRVQRKMYMKALVYATCTYSIGVYITYMYMYMYTY